MSHPPEETVKFLQHLLQEKETGCETATDAADPRPVQLANGWTAWRGTNRDGRVPWLPAELTGEPVILWQFSTSGDGLAGVAATDELVFVVDRDFNNTRDILRCLDAESGFELWAFDYAAPGQLDYGSSARATPVFDGERVYLQGAFGHLHCIDVATGEALWVRDYLADFGAEVPIWGFCASPLLVDGRLIVVAGGPEAFLVALDPLTGDVIWKVPGRKPAYCSFIVLTAGSRRQLIGYDEATLGGWDLETGERLWEVVPELDGDFNVPTPIDLGGRLLVTTENNGTRIYEFDAEGKLQPEPVCWNEDLAPDSSTPVVVGPRVFGVFGEMYCLNAAQELATLWTNRERVFRDYASLIASEDKVLVTTTSGAIILFDATTDTCEELGRWQLFTDDSQVHSHPALVGTRLYVRSVTSLLCVELPGQ